MVTHRQTPGMDQNHTKHYPNSSPSQNNNLPTQISHALTSHEDPRSSPRPCKTSSHIQNKPSTSSDSQSKLQYHSFSSSEDLPETQIENQNGWQQIRHAKRKRMLNSHPPTQQLQTETKNRYKMLMEDCSYPEASEKLLPPQSPKPPTIFLHGVLEYTEMIQSLTAVAKKNSFLQKPWPTMSLNLHVQLQKHIELLLSTARSKTFTIIHTS